MVSQTIFQKLTIIIVGDLTNFYVDAKLISIECIKLRERALPTQNCGERMYGEKSG